VSLRRCDELIDKLKAFSGAALTSAVEASYENMDERFYERLAHRQKEGDLDIAPLAQEIQHTMQVMRLDFALLYTWHQHVSQRLWTVQPCITRAQGVSGGALGTVKMRLNPRIGPHHPHHGGSGGGILSGEGGPWTLDTLNIET